VPHFVDSKDVGLIQLADFICYFLRRHIESSRGGTVPARYKDEEEKVARWIGQAFNQSLPKSATYMAKGRCDTAELFYKYAPSCIL